MSLNTIFREMSHVFFGAPAQGMTNSDGMTAEHSQGKFYQSCDNYLYRTMTAKGEIVDFIYLARMQTITANILTSDGPAPIHPDDLPKVLKLIKNPISFFNFFNTYRVRIETFRGEGTRVDRVEFHGRIVGGNPYKLAYIILKKHLEGLVNPFLVADIAKAFQRSICPKINLKKPLINFFSELDLPMETYNLIKELSDQIIAKEAGVKKKQSIMGEADLKAIEEEVEKNLNELVELPPPKKYWGPVNFLLNLSIIKKLDNSDIQMILSLIESNNKKELKKRLQKIYKNALKKAVSESTLKKSIKQTFKDESYGTLTVLIKHIFKQKPQKGDIDWKQEPSFYVDKKIRIQDIERKEFHEGVIIACNWMEGKQGYTFLLQDQTEIHIRSIDYDVRIIRRISPPLLTAIRGNILNEEEEFELLIAEGEGVVEGMKAGRYKVIYQQTDSPRWNIRLKNLASCQAFSLSNRESDTIEILHWDSNKDDYIPKQAPMPCEEFMKRFFIAKQESIHINLITPKNANHYIRFIDELNKNVILNEIKKKIVLLRQKLIENQELLNLLLDNLLLHHFKEIDIEAICPIDISEDLREITEKYVKLGVTYSQQEMIKRVVGEANYLTLTRTERSLIVSRNMEHLKESHDNIEAMRGKDVIVLVGYTGAGKSSAAAYFFGSPVKYAKNEVGDTVVIIKEKQKKNDKDQLKHPKIGQALGESETDLVEGYVIDNKLVIADTPGLHDTRGQDLCTNFSINQAVKVAERICLVPTVTIHDFLTDHASSVVNLFVTITEKFPSLFEMNVNTENFPVFLLITKKKQAKDEVIDGFAKRLFELYHEAEDRVLALQKEGKKEAELQEAQKRLDVWHKIKEMFSNQRVEFIDIEDPAERKDFLDAFRRSLVPIKKDQDGSALQDTEILTRYGDYIETFAHVWVSRIFTPYLIEIPETIQEAKCLVDEIKASALQIQENIQNIHERLEELKRVQIDAQETINQIEHVQKNPDLHNEFVLEELNQRVAKAVEERKNQLNKNANELREQIRVNTIEQESVREKIDRYTLLIKQLEGTVEKQEKLKQDFVEGIDTQSLLSIGNDSKDFVEDKKSKNKKNNVVHSVKVPREHKVVHFNSMEEFGQPAEDGDCAIMSVIGEGYVITPHSTKDGYDFTISWTGNVKPIIDVLLTQRKTYDPALIERTESDLTWAREAKADKEESLEEQRARLVELENEIEQLNSNLSSNIASEEKLKTVIATEILEGQKIALASAQEEAQKYEEEIEKSEERTRATQQKLRLAEKKLAKRLKRKRNLAIIIHAQLETAGLLRGFADLIFAGNKQAPSDVLNAMEQKRERMIKIYQEFKEMYDENIEKVTEECLKDLAGAIPDEGEKEKIKENN